MLAEHQARRTSARCPQIPGFHEAHRRATGLVPEALAREPSGQKGGLPTRRRGAEARRPRRVRGLPRAFRPPVSLVAVAASFLVVARLAVAWAAAEVHAWRCTLTGCLA